MNKLENAIIKGVHVQALVDIENEQNIARYQAHSLMKGQRISKSYIINKALREFFECAFDEKESNGKNNL